MHTTYETGRGNGVDASQQKASSKSPAFIAPGFVLLFIVPLLLKVGGVAPKLAHIHAAVFSLAIIIVMAVRLRSCRTRVTAAITVGFSAAALFYLQLIDVFADQSQSADYIRVVVAAMSFVLHGSPYFCGTEYVLYPPFYAEVISAIFVTCGNLAAILGLPASQQQIWHTVEYVFQNVLFLSVMLLLALSYSFCRKIGGLSVGRAAALTLFIVMSSAAVFWTARRYQANIFLTDLALLALLFVDRKPWLAALGAVLGANIKVYPALLFAPWIAAKRKKACLWFAAFLVLTVAAETLYAGRLSVWSEYFHTAQQYIATLPQTVPGWLLGSPNLLNENYQLCQMFHIKGCDLGMLSRIVHWEQILLCAWFGWRFYTAPQAVSRDLGAGLPIDAEQRVVLERSCDLFSLMLITGPTVLSDHYVLAIPIALWTLFVAFKQRPVLTSVGTWFVLAWSLKCVVPIRLEPLGLILLAIARRTKTGKQLDSHFTKKFLTDLTTWTSILKQHK